MPFKPGKSGNPKGKAAGTPTRVNKSVRAAFEEAFNILQDDKDAALGPWARANPEAFYKLAAKLIPSKIEMEGALNLRVVTGVPPTEDADELA